jgi:hypothetical protein
MQSSEEWIGNKDLEMGNVDRSSKKNVGERKAKDKAEKDGWIGPISVFLYYGRDLSVFTQ